ncbi:MAG: aminotransferase class I/II-fold pyridoxal phosphate-dependent enzyme [Kiloniellales bacterium]|nr:aminotransferase class I/II-fold pyridoxal phosphate-dependent enzyme [Kiloniellales bacterium]
MTSKAGPKTLSVQAGEGIPGDYGPISPPLVLASSFKVRPDAVGFSALDMDEESPYFYSRWSNPSLTVLEEKLAALEGGEAAVVFASGMAAISGLLLHLLSAGDHVILPDVCYAAVLESGHDILPRFGIEVSFVDTSDLEAIEAALKPNSRHIHLETPCNPILRLADVEAVSNIARKEGLTLSVDSTIASPLGLSPIRLGADFVIHSMTKYICGHGDALGGVVIGSKDRMAELRTDALIHFGGILGVFDAWLLTRSLHSLPGRMRQHQDGAMTVAQFLEAHPLIEKVLYPGLPSHPQAGLAKSQMTNFSSLLAFRTKNGRKLAEKLAKRLEVFTYAVSLGKSRSLIFYIPSEDFQRSSLRMDRSALARYKDWAGDGVFRVSVGLEDPQDLIRDLEQALS